LEAFTRLLKHLPVDTGLGFVLVQHLDPQHESALTQLLARTTLMPVREVTNNLRVQANHVYVIPPNANLGITKGVLKLNPRMQNRSAHHPIDAFFESLAQDQHECAIGVILSGTATDGTLGLEAIKAEGGITFAQDDSAKYDSMPRSAVAAGCVDFVLTPENIAKELARIAKHPYVANGSGRSGAELHSEVEREADQREGPEAALASGGHGRPRTGAKQARAEANARADGPPLVEQNGFKKILLLLRNHCAVDFSLYKSATIRRRITRRMVLNKHDTVEDYAQFLRSNVRELDALYSDCLISVTSFFRNPEIFEILERKVFPGLLQQRGDEPLRVWVLGCSTGQEAYSIAMAFHEASEKFPRARKLQVFATDLNEALLDKARHGLYTKNLAQDVSPERLRRFFVEEQGGYRVIKSLREMVVFARQNLISDPPFSRLDIVSCRNVLIYLEPALQKNALPTFHYALKPGGFLLLGASESIGGFTDLFEPLDRKHKIYSRKTGATPAFHLPPKLEPGEARPAPAPSGAQRTGPGQLTALSGQAEDSRGDNAQREADRLMVNQFAPPGVLINAGLQILQFRGATGAWLEPPTGKASFDVLKMARDGLMLPLRAAINKAKKENKIVRRENVPVRQNGKSQTVNVEVIPLKNLRERCFLILFEDAEKGISQKETKETKKGRRETPPSVSSLPPVKTAAAVRRNAELERDLAETRDYLQAVQEQSEASNEELQASNEEVQSANEELQSINEELETAKEELESSNEELTTVNEEMANRNGELSRLTGDLLNFQTSTTLGVLLLGRDLTIRRFSVAAEKQFNLTASDIGRPIGSIRHSFIFPKDRSSRGNEAQTPRSEARDQRSEENQSLVTSAATSVPVDDLEALFSEVITNMRERECEARDKDGRWYSLRARPYFTLDNRVDGAVLVVMDITDLKRTEREIKAARDYAEATIRTTRDPLLVLRADLRIESANDAFYKTFESKPKETENVLIYELDAGAWNVPELRKLLEDVIPQKRVFDDFEMTFDFTHIGRRTMLLNARRLDNASGTPERILLGMQDITESRAGAESLRRSEERYRTLFDLGPIAVYSIDASGVIQDFNLRAAELWGRKPAPGDSDEKFCGSFKMFRPDGTFMPHDQCPMAEVVSGKVTSVQDAEVFIERPDGSRVTVLVNIRPLKNDRGEVTGAINCFYDITHRKSAEEALRQSQIRLAKELAATQRLQDTSTLLIHGGDIHGLYQQILAAGIAIMQSDMASLQAVDEEKDALRLLASIGFDPDFDGIFELNRPDTKTSWSLARRTGHRVVMADIEKCYLSAGTPTLEDLRKAGIRAVQSTPLVSRSGRVIGVISTHWRKPHEPAERELRLLDVLARQAADLIERKQGEDALRLAQAQLADRACQLEQLVAERTARLQDTIGELEHFSYTITHDMRAPLRAMQGFGDILLNEPGDRLTSQNADYLRRIMDAADRMDALIRDSLQYAKIVREKIPLALVEPGPVLRGVLESYPSLQPPHMEIQIAEPLPAVIANAAGLAQCFSNLMANAIKFVKPGKVPHVRVWTERRGDFVRFWFEDNGIGIPHEYQDRIFRMFQQLDKSYEGTGIGLALVRKTAERMDGKVGVESEPGKGSRFWLEFKKANP
jgi:two-component system CheB/CheR fusion protein